MSSKKHSNESANLRCNRNVNKEENGSEPVPNNDKLFEPSLEMMVNDFDDESTLELEEQMASTEAQDPNAELNSLQRVSALMHFLIKISINYFSKKHLFIFRNRICRLRSY